MPALTAAVCDDDSYFLDALQAGARSCLSALGFSADMRAFSTGEDLLNAGLAFDLVLTDIKLPGISGIELVRQLRSENERCRVIFISSYQEYALQAFDLDAVHFCLKPVSHDKLAHAIEKAVEAMDQGGGKTLTIANGAQAQRIAVRDILFCEALGHRITIHTRTGSCGYFGTLSALQGKLDGRFFRCHKSYIVNLEAVVSKERDLAVLPGGQRVLISRRKQQEFAQRLLEVLRNEVLT